MNLKPRFLLLTIILFVIAAIPAWFAVRMLAEGIVEQWAILYAEKQALYDKSRTLQPIMREVALSRQLANSQYIRDWARNPGDKTKTPLLNFEWARRRDGSIPRQRVKGGRSPAKRTLDALSREIRWRMAGCSAFVHPAMETKAATV